MKNILAFIFYSFFSMSFVFCQESSLTYILIGYHSDQPHFKTLENNKVYLFDNGFKEVKTINNKDGYVVSYINDNIVVFYSSNTGSTIVQKEDKEDIKIVLPRYVNRIVADNKGSKLFFTDGEDYCNLKSYLLGTNTIVETDLKVDYEEFWYKDDLIYFNTPVYDEDGYERSNILKTVNDNIDMNSVKNKYEFIGTINTVRKEGVLFTNIYDNSLLLEECTKRIEIPSLISTISTVSTFFANSKVVMYVPGKRGYKEYEIVDRCN